MPFTAFISCKGDLSVHLISLHATILKACL